MRVGPWFILVATTAAFPLSGQAPVDWEPVVARVGASGYGEYQARIGRIRVPVAERRDAPSIDVAFIQIRSPSSRPDPPLFVFGAGPGGSGIREAENVLRELPGVIEHRDIVGMDQRGTGRSGPDLTRVFTRPFRGPSEPAALLREYRELATEVRA